MSNTKIKAAIAGASGYTGSELARLLMQHPDVEISMITSETHEGKPFSALHPQFFGRLDMPLVSAGEVAGSDVDVIFLALPHGVSMEFAEKWAGHRAPLIDFSGDFRLGSPKTYAQWYKKEHTFAAGLETAVYGLPEIHAAAIRNARLVANPGCYPTASILALAPLVAKDLIITDTIIIDAKSGLTGAGISANATTHFSNVNDNFKAYGVTSHRHTIEIEEQCAHLCGNAVTVQFTPHLLPVDRGILATVYARPRSGIGQAEIEKLYRNYYSDQPFVRIRDENPSLKDVRGSNFCDIKPIVDTRTNRVIVLSAIDNLVKGAAGQAVQNMNIMFGRPQETGLMQIPLQP
ncbi:MAG: N-acetyl-gamma-glutamyl-phosphate reductase [Balneolaceae bacterium]|nr:MAG: N-acetyl-gamma-glutamyl-phosphate reductase [Balneolaceae bacterium]